MVNKKICLGCSGNAQSGKDTLYSCLEITLSEHGIQTEQFSLANILKADLNKFLLDKVGISAYTKNIKEKEIIRPLFVEYGQIQRFLSRGKHWTSMLIEPIENSLLDGKLPIVTDIRYDFYPEDEYYWLKNIIRGELVFIKRTLPNGQIVPPANKEEAENNPKLEKQANYHLTWPTTEDIRVRLDYVKVQLKPLLEKILL